MKDDRLRREILARVSETDEKDFDGHTEFRRLTPEQKLRWLSSSAYWVFKVAQHNPKLGCARFLPDRFQ
jgi:hypothetical protein